MKKKLCLLLSLIMLLALAGCGAASAGTTAASGAARDAVSYSSDYAVTEENADYGGLAMTESASESSVSGEDGSALPEDNPDKIIYSADATVETTNFDETLSEVTELAEKYGGYIESSSVNGENYYSISRDLGSSRYASYTIRVPSSAFSKIMGSLSELGNVPYTYTYTENVTAEYYDTEARLTSYQAQYERLLEMLDEADTVEEIIAIDDKLTDLQYRIDALESTLKNWDRQVSYSTVNLSVEEVQEYTPESSPAGESYGKRLIDALTRGFENIGGFFSNLLLWIAGALPALIILAMLGAAIAALIKRCRRKRRGKKLPPAPQEEKKDE